MKAKAGTADCPFGQVPVCVDGQLKLAQMDAIMCHIGRKFGMYGKNLDEAAEIDMVMLGVEDLRKQYLKVIYETADEARFVENHINPATMKGRNGGAHFSFLASILERNSGGHGYVVGSKLSIADIQGTMSANYSCGRPLATTRSLESSNLCWQTLSSASKPMHG